MGSVFTNTRGPVHIWYWHAYALIQSHVDSSKYMCWHHWSCVTTSSYPFYPLFISPFALGLVANYKRGNFFLSPLSKSAARSAVWLHSLCRNSAVRTYNAHATKLMWSQPHEAAGRVISASQKQIFSAAVKTAGGLYISKKRAMIWALATGQKA